MSVPPKVVRTAVKIRGDNGKNKVAEFYDQLTDNEKKNIDLWLIRSNHHLVKPPSARKVRFMRLIEECFANGYARDPGDD
jgi:hypothetical protein